MLICVLCWKWPIGGPSTWSHHFLSTKSRSRLSGPQMTILRRWRTFPVPSAFFTRFPRFGTFAVRAALRPCWSSSATQCNASAMHCRRGPRELQIICPPLISTTWPDPPVRCTVEVSPQRLFHICSHQSSGLLHIELLPSTTITKTGGYPCTVPPIKEVAESSRTHTHTHTAHRCLDAGTQERIVTTEKMSKNHRSAHTQNHPVIPQIPSNLSNRPNPNCTDLFLSLQYIQPLVWCRGPRPKTHWYTHQTSHNCSISPHHRFHPFILHFNILVETHSRDVPWQNRSVKNRR